MIHLSRQKTLKELRDQDNIHVYDWSMTKQFLSCQRAFFYRHELGLILKSTGVSYAIEFGVAIHKTLEQWAPSSRTEDDDRQAISAFQESFEPHEEQPRPKKDGKTTRPTYTLIYGTLLLEEYFDKYRADNRTVIDTELLVAEELDSELFYGGRIDKLVSNNQNELRFVDYKTTKYPNNFRLLPNPQFQGYKFLMETLTGQHVAGEVDILGVSASKSPSEMLRRQGFDYTSDQQKAWRHSMRSHLRRMKWKRLKSQEKGGQSSKNQPLDLVKILDLWPMCWNCDPYFRECIYAPLCSVSTSKSLVSIMNSMYKQDFWDPFTTE